MNDAISDSADIISGAESAIEFATVVLPEVSSSLEKWMGVSPQIWPDDGQRSAKIMRGKDIIKQVEILIGELAGFLKNDLKPPEVDQQDEG